MYSTQLSARRELVEQLDSEPLFDYLVQNGVLDETGVDDIRNEKSEAQTNLALLKHLEAQRPGSVNLFINALRQTGQHQLANILDNSKRINPASGSGYLSSTRHKGQVSLLIQVKALKLPPETNKNFLPSHTREWVSLDDVKLFMGKTYGTAGTSQHLDIQESPDEDSAPKNRSCLCLCFRKLFQRGKTSKTKNGGMAENNAQNNQGLKSDKQKDNGKTTNHIKYMSADNVNINGNNMQNSPTTHMRFSKLQNRLSADLARTEHSVNKPRGSGADTRFSMGNIRNNAEIFRIKSEQFYRLVCDRDSPSSVRLLKYFEQDRGLLVLETEGSQGLVAVVNICMKLGQLEELQRDIHNGKLVKDLENLLITEDVLESIDAKGVKLTTEVDKDEFSLAEQELS